MDKRTNSELTDIYLELTELYGDISGVAWDEDEVGNETKIIYIEDCIEGLLCIGVSKRDLLRLPAIVSARQEAKEKIQHILDKAFEKASIHLHWKTALCEKSTSEIIEIIGRGLWREDVERLTYLHRHNGDLRNKIKDLLNECGCNLEHWQMEYEEYLSKGTKNRKLEKEIKDKWQKMRKDWFKSRRKG